ncbi:MAG: beta-N-acetylhexosaminidase [Verrucomicrobiota bacterium]
MKSAIAIGLTACWLAATALAATEPAVIPKPQKMERTEGEFKLAPDLVIATDAASKDTAKFLAERLRPATGYSIKTKVRKGPNQTFRGSVIFLTAENAKAGLGAEGYELTVVPGVITLQAPTQAGLFYGAQTLLQLLPPEIFSAKVVKNFDWEIPCVKITDAPRFPWRGLMLDVSRHFYTKQEAEKMMDVMALHKLNTFHWHLVDDQGWRIEIKKYPKLTSVGAWRAGVGFGLPTNSTTACRKDGRYGGFYTQKDIREVVACAQKLHITIVPEIEMPGHSLAALSAYPELGAGPGPFQIPLKGGVFRGIYSPAKPETFEFLQNVLTEVFELFPGKYIHIGGDEVPKGSWTNDPACLALMEREGLKSKEELQSWFTRRMETFINAHGKTLIGWSEILQGGLAQNAVVMDWIGGGREAASAGHDVVMSPTANCYFDGYQARDRKTEPRASGGFMPLRKVYAFEPVPPGLAPEFARHILGGQGNLWTEVVPNLKHAEYMIFPRVFAIAEATWSPKEARDYDDFLHRLKADEHRLDQLGVNYRSSALGDGSGS